MENIIKLAEQLGKAIADSPAAATLTAARNEMNANGDLTKPLTEFRGHTDKKAKLEQENKPVEVADKHTLQELQQKLVASATFKAFNEAQVEYADLMRRVNQAVQRQLADTEGE